MKKNNPTRNKSKSKVPVDVAVKRMRALQEQRRYKEALDISLQITQAHPDLAIAWVDAATNCIHLQHWQDAIRYGQTALGHGGETNNVLHDTLAHAYGRLGQWDKARRHGLQALDIRARYFSGEPVIPLPEPRLMPPPPSAQTRESNVIAFSLFGGDSKYCEPAVLNVQEQPHIYPHWVCRFYVDGSVPDHVIARLRAGGAQIVPVAGAEAQWPGPMWRFLALDDPQAHRILFRDADSVISKREAAAVDQWVASGKRFHMMRDAGSHTELILAGLWGSVAGSLPPLEKLMQRFMDAPIESRRFADQDLLRQYVWPYARASLIQHDSVFGFMDAVPFPDGERHDGFCVGDSEGSGSFTVETDLPNGSKVSWGLFRIEKRDGGPRQEDLICSYSGTVKNGVVTAHIPLRYVRWLEQGMAKVGLAPTTQHEAPPQTCRQPRPVTDMSEDSSQVQSPIDAAFKRMKTLHEQGHDKESLALCLQTVRTHPDKADVLNEARSLVDAILKRMKTLQEQGRYQESLDLALQITSAFPGVTEAWSSASVNCIHLARWEDAIGYAQAALKYGGNTLAVHAALSHAHGHLGQRDAARPHGLQVLNMRDRQFNGEPVMPLPDPGPLPPPPSAQTREHNVIAYSLFGRDSKYCETAVLNVQEQPQIYPHWVCRFYVDSSVPESVIARLRAGGAQIVQVDGPVAAQWPGPMWRLLALNDPQAHRILFRDADSVISRREAAAVAQWVTSGKRFHMMRDYGAHTDLMLAGLWGVVAGSLPPLEKLMQRFMSMPLESRHFADQNFLSQYVWPYARASLMQHDSVFGFMDAAPFPDEKMPEGFHVGCVESLPHTLKTDLPDGSEAVWELRRVEKLDNGQTREKLVCSYASTVQNGAVSVHVPVRYAQWIQKGTARLHLVGAVRHNAPAREPLKEHDAAVHRIAALHQQGRYEEALDICLQITRTRPEIADAWANAAVSCLWLRRWQDAARYGQIALARGCDRIELYDVLAHACHQLGQWDEARRYGLQSLNMSDRRFGGEPIIPLPESGPMPPPPSTQTREHNVIAFSLFGGNSKYCEPAVLNVQEQPHIYPHWVCRFYVDNSVPEHVINRLRAGGGQIVLVNGGAAQWPGPMWRFLALNDPQAHRILFRDADSVISQREAGAVNQWLTSGKRFHVMRDNGSHTALIPAGLWSVVCGSLPPLEKLMERFMNAPLESKHFADQDFLQQYVWPYARASLMQHDSVFGFMDAVPFPNEKGPDETNVGFCEGFSSFTGKSDLPDGSEVVWELRLIEKRDDGRTQEKLVCAYPATVRGGTITGHIPLRYARQLRQGTARLHVAGKSAA